MIQGPPQIYRWMCWNSLMKIEYTNTNSDGYLIYFAYKYLPNSIEIVSLNQLLQKKLHEETEYRI